MRIFRVQKQARKWFVSDFHLEFGPYSTEDKAIAACQTLNWRYSRPDMRLPVSANIGHSEQPNV